MKQIGTALQSVGHLHIETAPYIYLVETHPDYVGKMDAIFQQVIDRSIAVSSSVITLAEVLSHPLKQQHTRLVARRWSLSASWWR
ncbi:MAG: hypothetical protein GYB64_14800 [Chloroflexi bacterium]|nr:hypothetical protein [Chloroflexota bacterium]